MLSVFQKHPHRFVIYFTKTPYNYIVPFRTALFRFAATFAATFVATFVVTFVIVIVIAAVFGSSLAVAAEGDVGDGDVVSDEGGGNGVVPLIGAEVSYQRTSAIESATFAVTPGAVFQFGNSYGLATLGLSYSANTLNVKSIPALADYTIADTTDYQFESHLYFDRYSFTAFAQGTSFSDKLSTESYLDASYVDFSKRFSPYSVLDLNAGAGLLYVREGNVVFPFPVISANITTERFQATLGFPISYATYTVQEGKHYLTAATSLLGAGSVTLVSWDYLPTPDIDLSFGYASEDRNQGYGLLNNNTEISRTSESVSTKIQYKYFYAESSYYFTSKLRSYNLDTDERTSFVNYKEKPFASITVGAISYTM